MQEGAVAKPHRNETEEERRARKEKERAERKAKEQKEVEKQAAQVASGGDGVKKESEGGGAEAVKKEKKHKRDETEEERRARKEKERAERKAKERKEAEADKTKRQINDESNSTDGRKLFVRDDDVVYDEVAMLHRESQNDESAAAQQSRQNEELAAAMNAENDAIRQAADKAKEAARRDARRRAEEEREREALERREKRRKERETRGGRKFEPKEAAGAVVGMSSLGVADLQRQGYRTQFEKDLQRATALRRLVDMDDVSVALIDVPPQSQYDMYIRSFGDTGRKQVGVQVPAEEDRVDAEVQAERVRVRHRGAEVPGDLGLYPEQCADRPLHLANGGGRNGDGGSGGVGMADEADTAADSVVGDASRPQMVDSALLANFLVRVFPVMRTILDENDEEGAGREAVKLKSETQFSTSYTTFGYGATRNRPVVKVLFSPCTPTYVAVLHGPSAEEGSSKELDCYMSVILLWNIYDPSMPEKVLVSPSSISSICMSPRRPYLLYAGAENGSLYAWDTREPERNHSTAGVYENNAFRLPSFATSWLSGNHISPIVAVAVAGYNAAVGVRKDESEQLVSIDATGETRFWVVNEKDQSRGMISDTENGLHMFSTIRLFPATSKNDDRTSSVTVKQEAFALDFVPSDPSHYVVACAEGVRHISRFGSVAAPSVYGPYSRFFGTQIAVPSCVRYSTVDSRLLVVGYGDGSVRLYLHTEDAPQLSIPLSTRCITEIRCSGVGKWLFWVLDAGGTFYLLDLAKKDKEFPVFSQTLSQPDTGLCTCFDVPPEGKADTRVVALGFEGGIMQLHTLSELTNPPSSDRNEHWL
ncbi:WDdomain 60 [Trypanosoma grayi]|uniref:WDdomain 60 n=1 Tax=Trypanosoma grayi TaxID=71804 RepID=UPI0004F4BD6B|nr:WDdomain 60 [Trypanosoma grayi]KEG06931.1 WDdomain 60 [Trypanosoma grayi]